MIELFFSVLFLLVSYFLTTLALIQAYVPGTSKMIVGKNGRVRKVFEYGKTLILSLAIASIISSLMFYYFVYPLYNPS